MKTEIQHIMPEDIERTSMTIIREELEKNHILLNPETASVVLRAIHTTADFEYAHTLYFSAGVIPLSFEALRAGAHIVTDTHMTAAGISKKTLARFGGSVHCFMADEDVVAQAKERKVTRAMISMEKAAKLHVPLIFAIGNAPTALIRLCELIEEGFRPALVIGVPVGFVNVVASKEMMIETGIACIVNRGRKGGSNVAAAICNALLYEADQTRGNG